MDEKKTDVVEEMISSVKENYYNSGYIHGAVEGIKAGKKTGETVGWQKGFWFAVFTGIGGYFLWRLIKGMCREAVEFCKDEPKEENFREIKEEQDGSESV